MASRMMAAVAPGLQPGSAANGFQTVLVVEDSADDFFLLQRAFSHAGVSVTLVRAVDGDDAKGYLERALAAARLPICILADLRMPGMDGFEFARYVKEHPALSSIPLVILSVSANQKDIAALTIWRLPTCQKRALRSARVDQRAWAINGSTRILG